MRLATPIALGAIALFFTFLFGVDGVYVGMFASEQELALYPWGTERGWAYGSKTHYMIAGLAKTAISWLPLAGYFTVERFTRHPGKGAWKRADEPGVEKGR